MVLIFSSYNKAMSFFMQPTNSFTGRAAILPMAMAVGGDVSGDGRFVIIRNLTHACIWQRADKEKLYNAFSNDYIQVALEIEPQGEAVCFDSKGEGFYTTSEKENQPIYYFENFDLANELVQ